MESVLNSVLKRVVPSKSERIRIESLSHRLEERVISASREMEIKARVRVEGSVAKDTWLSSEPDIDIFMRVSPEIPRKSLGEVCLKVARKTTEGYPQIERFAEHPYLEAIVERTRINIVPCYNVKRREWLSATDRTPFHTDYIKKNFGTEMHNEVRLLKKFMKGIEVYGAEIKIGGFSGYLCELLILHYKSFTNVLRAFADYKDRIVIDIENYYINRARDLNLLFTESLVVIDPVDKARNVASAVQDQRLYSFIAASRDFLLAPDGRFFYPKKISLLTPKELKRHLTLRGSTLLAVILGGIQTVPDVLWGQIYKSQRSLRKMLETYDFVVLRDTAWSDEKTVNVFLFELELRCLSAIRKHLGPPLQRKAESEKFLGKYAQNPVAISGPYVENGRWVVEVKRRYIDAITFLQDRLESRENLGMADKISSALQLGFKILVNEEINELYGRNKKFAEFFTEFLSGKPKWLKNSGI